MLGLGTEHTYYYHLATVDIRKGFDGLSGLAHEHMEQTEGKDMFYTFFATCKKLNINPFTWLSDIIDRIPE